MRQSSKRMFFAALLLGLSGCTAQAGPSRYLVIVPTDTQLSCDEIGETREQVLTAAINAYQNGHYKGVNDLTLRSKYLRALYKRKGCEERDRLWCIAMDLLSFQEYGYSMEESILQNPDLATDDVLQFLRVCRRLTGE